MSMGEHLPDHVYDDEFRLQAAWEEERTALVADAQNTALRLEKDFGIRLQVIDPGIREHMALNLRIDTQSEITWKRTLSSIP